MHTIARMRTASCARQGHRPHTHLAVNAVWSLRRAVFGRAPPGHPSGGDHPVPGTVRHQPESKLQYLGRFSSLIRAHSRWDEHSWQLMGGRTQKARAAAPRRSRRVTDMTDPVDTQRCLSVQPAEVDRSHTSQNP